MTAITEKKAIGKWCPMVRHQSDGSDPSGNRAGSAGIPDPTWNTCWASDCMMWRWVDFGNDAGEALGYCGLSGEPK